MKGQPRAVEQAPGERGAGGGREGSGRVERQRPQCRPANENGPCVLFVFVFIV